MNPQLLENGKYYHIYNQGVGNRNLFENKNHYERFLYLYVKYINPIAETYAWVLMRNHFHCLVRIKENVVYKYRKEDFQQQPDSVPAPVRLGSDIKDLKNSDSAFGRLGNMKNVENKIKNISFNDVKWETIDIDDLINNFNHFNTPNLSDPVGADRLKMLKLKANEKIELLNNNNYKIPIPHLHFSHLFNAYGRYFNKNTDSRGTLFERPFNRVPVENEKYLKTLVVYIHNNPVKHGFCSHTLEYPWSSYLSMFSDNDEIINRNEVLEWFGNVDNYKFMHNKRIDNDEIDNWLKL